MIRIIILFSIFFAILCSISTEFASNNPNWEEYKRTFGKIYKNEQIEREHEEAFLRNSQKIKWHNEAFAKGESTFRLGYSPLTDLTESEWKRRNGFRAAGKGKKGIFGSGKRFEKFSMAEIDVETLPESVDWRRGTNGSIQLVTPVKKQGECGSCWTFSATGVLEAAHAKATGELISLSEQNLVDCDKSMNLGCEGGDELLAIFFVMDQGGLNVEEAYPYVGMDGENCKFNETGAKGASTISRIIVMPRGDELAMKAAIAKEGPISVAVEVTAAFRFYSGGVLNDEECSNKYAALNHAVLVVGYGTDPKLGEYWIVKNSWGEQWGEEGYIRMGRNKNNQCGIATEAFYVL